MKRSLVLGGPGTGKTQAMMSVLDKLLDSGVRPEKIAFVSFTQRAVDEARDRAITRFQLQSRRFPYFRTIHSMCFREIGMTRDRVMTASKSVELFKKLGIKRESAYVFLEELARTSLCELRDVWERHGGYGISWDKLDWYKRSLLAYKREFGFMDFTDMLTEYMNPEYCSVPVDYAIIDEAQDLSSLQWQAVEKAFSRCVHVYFAGDDDQTIYAWSGANTQKFLTLNVNYTKRLKRSRRLPSNILEYSQRMISIVHDRYVKDLTPAKAGGVIDFARSVADISFEKDEWLILARNNYCLDWAIHECEKQGVLYTCSSRKPGIDQDDVTAIITYENMRKGISPSKDALELLERKSTKDMQTVNEFFPIWHDEIDLIPLTRRIYYLAVLRNGRQLWDKPNVRISTIHAIKGAEAENVFLISDISAATADEQRVNPDGETRVWYVAATRAKRRLVICDQMEYGNSAFGFLRSFVNT